MTIFRILFDCYNGDMKHLDFNDKTVLVTGASGFIGSHLCNKLLESGAKVISVDNFLSGRKENLKDSLSHERFTFIQADVTQSPESYLPQDLTLDIVLHFASPASPPRYQAYPVETYLVNSHATHLLLSYIRENHPSATFLFASTSEIYGDPEQHPQTESYWGNVNPNGIRSCYDEAKRMGETICGVFHREFDLDTRIVRIFNTYGPHMDPDDGRIIPNFVNQALRGEKMTIYGDGSQTRSYCYIDDLVAGILAFAVQPELAGETINLGNPHEYTVLQTAEVIKQAVSALGLSDKQVEIEHHPLPQDDPRQRCPDISKAEEVLDWKPQVEFEEGIKKTIQYFHTLQTQ